MLQRPVQCSIEISFQPASEITQKFFWLSCRLCELRPCDPRDMFCHHSSSFRSGRNIFRVFLFLSFSKHLLSPMKVEAFSGPLVYYQYYAAWISDNGAFHCTSLVPVWTVAGKLIGYPIGPPPAYGEQPLKLFPDVPPEWFKPVQNLQDPGMTCRVAHIRF